MQNVLKGPAKLAPIFISAIIAVTTLASAGCGEFEHLIESLEDSNGQNESQPQRKAHTYSPLIPVSEDGEDYYYPNGTGQQTGFVRTNLTPDDCQDITDEPAEEGFIIVARIVDGDTIRALNTSEAIRLWGIDAPETDQLGGQHATDHLEYLIMPGEILKTKQTATDQYGRKIMILNRESGANINHLMVQSGWAYPYYGPGDLPNPCLESAQRNARAARRGLWRDNPAGGTRPWDWRHQNR